MSTERTRTGIVSLICGVLLIVCGLLCFVYGHGLPGFILAGPGVVGIVAGFILLLCPRGSANLREKSYRK